MTIIEQIHKEFNEFEGQILQSVSANQVTKAARLLKAGFASAIGTETYANEVEIAERVTYYRGRYPLCKFITKDAVDRINGKYNLVCGPVGAYTGFVPDIKLRMIESFKIDDCDLQPPRCIVKKVWGSGKQEFHEKYTDGIVNIKDIGYLGVFREQLGSVVYIDRFDPIDEQSLMICAPKKHMKLSGLSLVKGLWYKLGPTQYPDPVVLQPVKGGYLIVAAWGDEASDPEVVNEINN